MLAKLIHCELCDGRKHIQDEEGNWNPCRCRIEELNRVRLGYLYDPTEPPTRPSGLEGHLDGNRRLLGPWPCVKSSAAGAVLTLSDLGGTWATLDSQQVLDIWLSDDRTLDHHLGVDLLVFILGFGELPNKRRPENILHVLDFRGLRQLPLWIYLDFPKAELAHRYNQEVARRIEEFEEVEVSW